MRFLPFNRSLISLSISLPTSVRLNISVHVVCNVIYLTNRVRPAPLGVLMGRIFDRNVRRPGIESLRIENAVERPQPYLRPFVGAQPNRGCWPASAAQVQQRLNQIRTRPAHHDGHVNEHPLLTARQHSQNRPGSQPRHLEEGQRRRRTVPNNVQEILQAEQLRAAQRRRELWEYIESMGPVGYQ